MKAVEQNGLVLRNVVKKNMYICLAAVTQNGLALEFFDKQYNYCCDMIYETNYEEKYLLVKNLTFEICYTAVKQNGLALEFVHFQTPDLCFEAVKQDGLALKFVHYGTEKIYLEAVNQNGDALQFVKKCDIDTKTVFARELYRIAVKQNRSAIKYVDKSLRSDIEKQTKHSNRIIMKISPELKYETKYLNEHGENYESDPSELFESDS